MCGRRVWPRSRCAQLCGASCRPCRRPLRISWQWILPYRTIHWFSGVSYTCRAVRRLILGLSPNFYTYVFLLVKGDRFQVRDSADFWAAHTPQDPDSRTCYRRDALSNVAKPEFRLSGLLEGGQSQVIAKRLLIISFVCWIPQLWVQLFHSWFLGLRKDFSGVLCL